MTLALLDCLSLPGDPAKANEDAYGHDGHAALVMDGATMLGDGLMPGPSDAAWIARFGARRILAHLKEGEGARKALRGALEDAKKSFEALRRMPPEDVWQTPCASMMLVTQTQAGRAGEAARPNPRPVGESRRGLELEFLWFGDCAALVQQDGTPAAMVGETFESRAAEAQRAQRLAREKQLSPAHGLSRRAFLAELRASRNRINRGSSWLFSPEPRAAAHAGRRILKVKSGAHLLLASDGFLALASDYGAYGVDSLMAAARNKGLAALGEELRAIENEDAGGDRFARFKKSDDCTALLLRLD